MSTQLEERVDEPQTEDDDDHFKHYFWHPEPGRAEVMITEARVMGTPIKAVCGRVVVPSRDPDRYPLCKDCERVFKEWTGKL